MNEDPAIAYQKLTDETAKLFFPILIALQTVLGTIYLSFKEEKFFSIILLTIGFFLMMIICLIWYKKVELLALTRDATIEYLKKIDPDYNRYETFKKVYFEKERKKRNYKNILSFEYYDSFFPKLLSGGFLLIFIVLLLTILILA